MNGPGFKTLFTSISACGVWEVRTGIQVFRKDFHTHIRLDYIRVEFLSCINKKKNQYVLKYKHNHVSGNDFFLTFDF